MALRWWCWCAAPVALGERLSCRPPSSAGIPHMSWRCFDLGLQATLNPHPDSPIQQPLPSPMQGSHQYSSPAIICGMCRCEG